MKRCFNCMNEYEEGPQPAAPCPCCGWDETQDKGKHLEPGVILRGRYIVGTLRAVNQADLLYMGWDALFARRVLIQEYFPEGCASRAGAVPVTVYDAKRDLFERGKARFTAQGQKLIELDDTRNLLSVYSVFEENNTAYRTLEYPGENTIRRRLEGGGRMPVPDLRQMMENLRIPLEAVHKHGFTHGQLSLECLYITDLEEFRAGGFNDAAYFCSEQMGEGQQPGPGADVYGTALLAAQALLGPEQWGKRSLAENLDELRQNFPPEISGPIGRALTKNAAGEAQTISRLMDQLSAPAAGQEHVPESEDVTVKLTTTVRVPATAHPGGNSKKNSRNRRKLPFIIWGAGLAALISLACISAVLIQTRHRAAQQEEQNDWAAVSSQEEAEGMSGADETADAGAAGNTEPPAGVETVTAPSVIKQEGAEPSTAKAGAADPPAVKAGATEAATGKPDATEPPAAKSGAAVNSGATEPPAAKPAATEPPAAKTKSNEPQSSTAAQAAPTADAAANVIEEQTERGLEKEPPEAGAESGHNQENNPDQETIPPLPEENHIL